MSNAFTVVLAILFFIAVFSFIGGFEMLDVYIPPVNQSYIHGYIDLDSLKFVPLNGDDVVGSAVLKNKLECKRFSLEIDVNYPVEATVFYYDENGKAIAVTESITGSLDMAYKDMPDFCSYIRVQVRRTDGGYFSDADLLTLSSKVRLVISTKKQALLDQWLDSFNKSSDKYSLLPAVEPSTELPTEPPTEAPTQAPTAGIVPLTSLCP